MGQTDTDLAFDELTDPQGINFWPEPVGRDNTRTPMVWDDGVNGGFSRGNGTPWLPVKAPQLARNVASQQGVPGSVLETYRALIGFRKASAALMTGQSRFHDLPEPVLAFTRGTGDQALTCVFNLSPQPKTLTLSGLSALTGPSDASLTGATLSLGPNGYAWLTGAVGLSLS